MFWGGLRNYLVLATWLMDREGMKVLNKEPIPICASLKSKFIESVI
jgi:hypothetical protein